MRLDEHQVGNPQRDLRHLRCLRCRALLPRWSASAIQFRHDNDTDVEVRDLLSSRDVDGVPVIAAGVETRVLMNTKSAVPGATCVTFAVFGVTRSPPRQSFVASSTNIPRELSVRLIDSAPIARETAQISTVPVSRSERYYVMESVKTSRARATLFATIIVIMSAASAALVFVLAWAWFDPPIYPITSDERTAISFFLPDKHAGYRMAPNLSARDSAAKGEVLFSVFTDERGARIGDGDLRERNAVDILLIGCSQTFGHGVEHERTFAALLGEQSRASVANFGVSGQSGVGALALLRNNLDLKPSTIVYGLWADHPNRNFYLCADGSPACVERPYLEAHSNGTFVIRPPHSPEASLARARDWYMGDNHSITRDIYWKVMGVHTAVSVSRGQDYSEVQKNKANMFVLNAMAQSAQDIGAQLVVVYIPIYFDPKTMSAAPDGLARFAADRGFVLIDMTKRFHAMLDEGVRLDIPNDGHLSESAHQAIAEEIGAKLAGNRHAQR